MSATVTAVSNSASNSKLKLDNIRDLILSEDVRRKSSGESSSSGSALSTETRGRSSQKGRQKRGHFTNQCKAPRKNNNN